MISHQSLHEKLCEKLSKPQCAREYNIVTLRNTLNTFKSLIARFVRFNVKKLYAQ